MYRGRFTITRFIHRHEIHLKTMYLRSLRKKSEYAPCFGLFHDLVSKNNNIHSWENDCSEPFARQAQTPVWARPKWKTRFLVNWNEAHLLDEWLRFESAGSLDNARRGNAAPRSINERRPLSICLERYAWMPIGPDVEVHRPGRRTLQIFDHTGKGPVQSSCIRTYWPAGATHTHLRTCTRFPGLPTICLVFTPYWILIMVIDQ